MVRIIEGMVFCIALLSAPIHLDAQNPDHRKRAEEYARKGEIQSALSELGKIRHPTSDDLSSRGELLIQLGRPHHESAAKAFRDALRLDERNARALYGLGVLADARANFAEAEAFFRRALGVQPKAVHAQNALAGALMYQGKYDEAERLYLALEGDPAVGSLALGNLGELYLRQGKLDLAETKLKGAIMLLPENFDWHRQLAEVYRLQGKRKVAADECRKALELLPRSPAADNSLRKELAKRLKELEQ